MIATPYGEALTSAAKKFFLTLQKQIRFQAALFRFNFFQVDRPEAVGDQTRGDIA